MTGGLTYAYRCNGGSDRPGRQCNRYIRRRVRVSETDRLPVRAVGKKVDKHNTVIERTYKLEETQAVIQEQIKVVNHRISDLEREE